MRTSISAAARLDDAILASCPDHKNSRLIIANRQGINQIRAETLIMAAEWLDESTEGYQRYSNHLRSISSIAIREDGQFLVTCSNIEDFCIVHKISRFGGSRLMLHQVIETKETVLCVAYGVSDNVLLVSTADKRVRCWDLQGKDRFVVSTAMVHEARVTSMRCCLHAVKRKRLLGCVCADGGVWIWDYMRHTLLSKIVLQPRNFPLPSPLKERAGEGGTWRGHTDAVVHIDFSEDGMLAATASRDSSCKVWNLVPVLYEEEEAERLLCMGHAMFLAEVQEAVETTGGSALLSTDLHHFGPCTSCSFLLLQGRQLLVTVSEDGSCVGWYPESGDKVFKICMLGGRRIRLLEAQQSARQDSLSSSSVLLHFTVGKWLLSVKLEQGKGDAGVAGSLSQFEEEREDVEDEENKEKGGVRAAGQTMNCFDCPWLVILRQQFIQAGIQLKEIPWLLSSQLLPAWLLLEVLLHGVGLTPGNRTSFRSSLLTLGISASSFLALVAVRCSTDNLSKYILMIFANANPVRRDGTRLDLPGVKTISQHIEQEQERASLQSATYNSVRGASQVIDTGLRSCISFYPWPGMGSIRNLAYVKQGDLLGSSSSPIDKVQVEATHLSRLSQRSGAEELLASLQSMRALDGEDSRMRRDEYLEDMTSPGMTKVVKEILQEEEANSHRKREGSRIVSYYPSSSPRSRVNVAAAARKAAATSSSAPSDKSWSSRPKKVVEVKMNSLPTFGGGEGLASSLEGEQSNRNGERRRGGCEGK
ncbi:hypothetical protein GUITHDRAFT_141632 [Guillardia theta CCMP2712]|uniref:Uncharacterized protein n=1 Tax=Guillardia theta (strain CCMP2712) TaxID=905079 RepID=L1J168_GUITC|nr:hypothetical protein GUITHDRAFT_141632 [Guillardia theta CCMP2712]EKX41879.1 hypothetical protein GUITHDRAFT_141632 [Guillardia theta CCMP2712]|eukprot:XP_005828859.1 hypothetical protein GUITHDRAFT_141632 [Guillardia theta CCMP2712]